MSRRLHWLSVGAMALGACSLSTVALAQNPYKIVDHWKIGGEGGWDYLKVDSAAHLLYITHGPAVEVVSTETGKVIHTITGLKGTHGVAFDANGKYGYISDGGANEVVVFDRHSFEKVAEIPAGTNPDGITYDPSTNTVWAFNGRSRNATVIDVASQKVIGTVALPGKPEFPQADGKGNVYDNIEDKNEVVRIDAKTLKVTAEWPLAGCDSPSGMAIDIEHHRLFSVCDGKKMAVVDTESGKVLATPAIGDGPDAASYDPTLELAFSSNGDGTLTVVDAKGDSYGVLQTLPTQHGARTMTYDPIAKRAYLVTAEFGPMPAAVPGQTGHRRPPVIPGSFTVIVVGRE
ncbi:YncE family protein [Silvibacterium dinghuense]|uniref:YncE family protein n=2 Tax=Silvibacterium dinghuense TaxID=1560006 RepID=A0A4Q1SEL2_9BACT|nr:YncE family protein [Silvibacterium dinghuense]RXS95714.1 YncE family protein [Silvibacterium dinghuense]